MFSSRAAVFRVSMLRLKQYLVWLAAINDADNVMIR